MSDEKSNQKSLAVTIAQKVNHFERDALQLWLSNLLDLREAKLPKIQKTMQALALT